MRVAGVLLSLAAAGCFGTGLALQKRRAVALPPLGAGTWRAAGAFARDARWLLATALVLAGWGFEAAALARAPVAVVLPVALAGVAIVGALSARWVSERLAGAEWAGVALCLAGTAASAVSAQGEAPGDAGFSRLVLGIAAGALAAASALALALSRRARRADLALASAAGLLYAASGLLTKALVVLLSAHGLPEAIAVAVFLAATSLAALLALQAAFQRGRATVAVAWCGTISTFLPAALGSPVFGEAWPEGPALWLRLLALGAVLAGYLLLLRPAARLQGGAEP